LAQKRAGVHDSGRDVALSDKCQIGVRDLVRDTVATKARKLLALELERAPHLPQRGGVLDLAGDDTASSPIRVD
jgi:hypothetical protein